METGLTGHSSQRSTGILTALAWILVLWVLTPLAQAANYNFSGDNVSGCSRSGTIYTCATLPLSEWNDSMTIGDGISVNVDSNVGFGYNQTLKMSGTARLTSKGSLNIADIAPANLQISGGFLVAAGAFNVGNQNQTLTADITAGSLYIGNGSALTINGALKSSGVVNLGSHTVINGPISGSAIYTNSPVKINGAVVAGTEFILASGSTVTGNVTAPVTRILASGVVVTGNVTASTSLTLESGNRIVGDVSAGTLTTTDSEGIVDGNAIVDKAVLGWAGRVTKFITCRSGDTTGNCSCVVNNSGYAVNSAYGPRCTATTPAAPPKPHHLRIVHETTMGRCAPTQVGIIACANAACTAPHASGTHNVTFNPGGTSHAVSGAVSTPAPAVSWSGNAGATLSVSPAGTNPTVCVTSTGTVTNCGVTFENSSFTVTVPASHTAETEQTLTIQALKFQDKTQKCIPAYQNVSRTVQLRCGAGDGTITPVRVQPGTGQAWTALNAANSAQSACDAAGQSVNLYFDADGVARPKYLYADAGEIAITADAQGPGTFKSLPASLAFTNVVSPVAAGPAQALVDIQPKLSRGGTRGSAVLVGRNAAGNSMPKFTPKPSDLSITARSCAPVKTALLQPPFTISAGTITVRPEWNEVGTADVEASLNSYLGVGLNLKANTRGDVAACTGDIGAIRFVPAYFDIEQTTVRSFYYSGEVIALRITAMNAAGGVTASHAGALASDLTLTATLPALPAGDAPPGTLTSVTLRASQFVNGRALTAVPLSPASQPGPLYTFGANPTRPPWRIQLAAADALSASLKDEVDGNVWIRSGRLRLSNRFGVTTRPILLPVAAEYWTGSSWMHNAEDSFTTIPLRSVALTARAVGLAAQVQGAAANESVRLIDGRATIQLNRTSGIGPLDIAINLGTTSTDMACLANHPNTSGANLAFLRSLYGRCNAPAFDDPSARATFGVFSPETRRIIHVRESFR